jgi:phage terminase large subunit-like protein
MQQSRQEKLEYLKLLDEKERRRADNPLLYCKRHPKQLEAHEATQAIRALFWGNRVGKTEWGGEEVSEYATEHHPYREVRAPFEIWCACPSFDVQEHTTQQKLLRYIPKKDIEHIEYLRGKIIKKITLKNGVVILFKSYEQGREKFQGAGVRLIWFDEEPPQDIWDECFVRVEAGQQLDVILTMTAIKGMTWVYNRIYQDTANPDLFVSTAGWDDNPFLTDKQKEQMSRGLSPASLLVRREGKFTKRVGLVCGWFDRSVHMKHYDHLDRGWTWYEVLDGGWSDPAAWLLIGVDHDNNVHVVNGFRRKHLKAEDIKEERDKKSIGLTITAGWSDNDNPRLNEELNNLRMLLTPVVKEPGEAKSWDDALATKLEEFGAIQAGTGEPRLFISDNLIEFNEQTGNDENWLMQEIENLVWQEKVTKAGEEHVPKWDDHRRYGHHFDGIRALAYFLVSYASRPDTELHVYKPPEIVRLKQHAHVTNNSYRR